MTSCAVLCCWFGALSSSELYGAVLYYAMLRYACVVLCCAVPHAHAASVLANVGKPPSLPSYWDINMLIMEAFHGH
jgi:hypothetical protein